MKTITLNILLILRFLCFFNNVYAKELSVKLFVNGNITLGAKFYLIVADKGHLLASTLDKIILPDSLHGKYRIIVVYKRYRIMIPVVPTDIQYLEIYNDNRIFHNLANAKSGGDWFKLKYLFKTKYLVDFGNGVVAICHQPPSDYLERYRIENP